MTFRDAGSSPHSATDFVDGATMADTQLWAAMRARTSSPSRNGARSRITRSCAGASSVRVVSGFFPICTSSADEAAAVRTLTVREQSPLATGDRASSAWPEDCCASTRAEPHQTSVATIAKAACCFSR